MSYIVSTIPTRKDDIKLELKKLKVFGLSVALATVATACSSSISTKSHSTPKPLNQTDAIITAFKNAENAILLAQMTQGRNINDLQSTVGNPDLSNILLSINQIKQDNYIFKGTVTIQTVKVLKETKVEALVEACGIDSGWYMDPKTGKSVLGTSQGSSNMFDSARMIYTSNSWKLNDEKIREASSPCKI